MTDLIGHEAVPAGKTMQDWTYRAHCAKDYEPWPCRAVLLDENARLQRERDLARAHDTQPYPTAWAYEQACRVRDELRDENSRLRAILRDTKSALSMTVTVVPSDGSRPHWCRYTNGRHDATCGGMLKVQDLGREILGQSPVKPEPCRFPGCVLEQGHRSPFHQPEGVPPFTMGNLLRRLRGE